jgi:serine/threonine-protein kinase NIM1
VASGLSYLHQLGMIHRDLKAENVFFTGVDRVVVGDFGFATRVDSTEQHLNTFCGSPPYAAPELFVDDHYLGPAVDIWALGVLLYFLVTGSMPFRAPTVASLKAAILEGSFSCPASLSPDCDDLIVSMLRRKPSSRASLPEIASHPWAAGCAWPSGDRGYRPYPRLGAENLSDTEKSVFRELEVLGVGEQLLRRELVRGVRSPAIAAYRLLLHRALRGAGTSGRARSAASRRASGPGEARATGSRRDQRSRACLLL